MRVFLTGATGFVGSAVAAELIGAGHEVLGQARSDAAAKALRKRGIAVHRGDLDDPASFAAGAKACDGVIHTAFSHDFARFVENMAVEQRAVVAMLDAMEGSGKPLVITSGIGMLAPGRVALEADRPQLFGRGETEELVRAAATRGVRSGVIRLPPTTHEDADGGFTPPLIEAARAKGAAAYVGDGANRWCACHRLDAALLYRLALEKGEAGGIWHAIGDEGIPTRQIAEHIGARLGLPTVSITPEQAAEHLGFVGGFFALDLPASAAVTREKLGWRPTHAGLLADIDHGTYFERGRHLI